MVQNIEFVPIAGVQDELVEPRVVGHGIAMEPVAPARAPGETASGNCAVIDVKALQMLCGIPVVGQVGGDVLNEVVPCVPFPDHVSAGFAFRCNFQEGRGPERAVFVSEPADRSRLLWAVVFPSQQDHVPIGQPGHVVVVVQGVVGEGVAPHQVPFPGKTFNAPAHAATIEDGARLAAGSQQGAVFEEVGGFARPEFAVPLIHNAAAVVDEVGARGAGRRDQGIAVKGFGHVGEQAHGLGREPSGEGQQETGEESLHRTKDAWRRQMVGSPHGAGRIFRPPWVWRSRTKRRHSAIS